MRQAQTARGPGATVCGKPWRVGALAHQAVRSGFSVLYTRAARLFDELQVAHGDGSFARRLTQLAKLDLLVIDDFGIAPSGAAERSDLLELLADRVGRRSPLLHLQHPSRACHDSKHTPDQPEPHRGRTFARPTTLPHDGHAPPRQLH